MSHNWIVDNHLWSIENCSSETKNKMIKELRQENKKLEILEKENKKLKRELVRLRQAAELLSHLLSPEASSLID